jgi:hypothetical protein
LGKTIDEMTPPTSSPDESLGEGGRGPRPPALRGREEGILSGPDRASASTATTRPGNATSPPSAAPSTQIGFVAEVQKHITTKTALARELLSRIEPLQTGL